jgi:hypothetical protein
MLKYLKHIEKFIREQHFGHTIWNISISAPYNQKDHNEGLIEVAYTDNSWHQKTYMFIYNQPTALNNDIYDILYKQDGIVIFEEK